MTADPKVKILADSISPNDFRLTTFECTFPRIVLAEVNTHRVLSRNSASSRAIPIEKMIQRVLESPYVPTHWGKNQKGMAAGADLEGPDRMAAEATWAKARDLSVSCVKTLLELGLHKQITNRLLEPFMWHTALITATEWSNLENLRDNKDAHPDFRDCAHAVRELRAKSEPKKLGYADWHAPLLRDEDFEEAILEDPTHPLCVQDKLIKISSGRCARVSYLTHEGKREQAADVKLHDGLLGNGHMCYDEKTEVLTRDGWKSWPTVTDSDLLFAVDLNNGTGHFEKPSALHSYPVSERLYHVYGQQLDLMVTSNHRMVVCAKRHDGTWTPYQFESAADVHGKPRRYLKSATFEGHGDVPAYDRSNPFMALLGFAIGDGYSEGGNQIQFHLLKRRKIEFLISLGFPVRALANDKFVVELPRLGEWFRANCYDEATRQKRLPEWVLSLTNSQALALLSGLRNSDGSARRKTWVYSTTSRQVADLLQALLHIHGKVGSLTFTSYGDGGTAIRVNVSDRVAPRVEIGQEGRALSYNEEWVQYSGIVYCATVSTGALMVRRNDHVAVSGNSPFEHVARPMTTDELDLFKQKRLEWNAEHRCWVWLGARYEREVRSESGRSALLMRCNAWDDGAYVSQEGRYTHFLGNVQGWCQYRKLIPNEHDILGARE